MKLNFVCTLPSGGQYHDVNGKVRFARKGRPFSDADQAKMMSITTDEAGDQVKKLRYGFEIFKGPMPGEGYNAAEHAKQLRALASENAELKAELDEERQRNKDIDQIDKDEKKKKGKKNAPPEDPEGE